MNSSFSGELNLGNQITIPGKDISETYRTMNYALVVTGGVKYKVGGVYLTGDIRYQYGLHNVADEDYRYARTEVNEILHRNGFINNDFSINQIQFNLGLIIPYFKPKKLIN